MNTENLLFKIIMSVYPSIIFMLRYLRMLSTLIFIRMYYQVTKQEGAYFNTWRIIPYQHKDLIDILDVATAARNR